MSGERYRPFWIRYGLVRVLVGFGAMVRPHVLLARRFPLSHPSTMPNDSKTRCPWASAPDIYTRYHDEEWGVPLHDDQALFEFLLLESFQAGLSWLTILRKRDNFRAAFRGFDPQQVASFGGREIATLMRNAGIVRNRAKILAAIGNARAFLAVQEQQGSFDRYIWHFVDGRPVVNHWREMRDLPAHDDLAIKISKDLKRRGFRFVGPTVVYAHMQATGMVNDHLVDCFRHRQVAAQPAKS